MNQAVAMALTGRPVDRTSTISKQRPTHTEESKSDNEGTSRRSSSPVDASREIRFHYSLFPKATLSESPILDLLNCPDKELQDELTERWRNHKLEELNFVGVVAALLTGCLTSTGSWPTILPTQLKQPWPIRTLWFIGIVFGLASILLAAAQTIRLHRISAHRNACHRIRLLIKGGARRKNGFIVPNRLRMYMWQLPVAFLTMSVVTMVAGIWVLVWSATIDSEVGFGWNNTVKSAVIYSSFAGISVIIFVVANRILHRDIHEEEEEDSDEPE